MNDSDDDDMFAALERLEAVSPSTTMLARTANITAASPALSSWCHLADESTYFMKALVVLCSAFVSPSLQPAHGCPLAHENVMLHGVCLQEQAQTAAQAVASHVLGSAAPQSTSGAQPTPVVTDAPAFQPPQWRQQQHQPQYQQQQQAAQTDPQHPQAQQCWPQHAQAQQRAPRPLSNAMHGGAGQHGAGQELIQSAATRGSAHVATGPRAALPMSQSSTPSRAAAQAAAPTAAPPHSSHHATHNADIIAQLAAEKMALEAELRQAKQFGGGVGELTAARAAAQASDEKARFLQAEVRCRLATVLSVLGVKSVATGL